MKRLFFLIPFLFISCDWEVDILFKNKTDNPVVVCSDFLEAEQGRWALTTKYKSFTKYVDSKNYGWSIADSQSYFLLWCEMYGYPYFSNISEEYYKKTMEHVQKRFAELGTDTVHFYIMDTTIIKELSLQEIIFEKKYIQCYDMSISDFSKFEKIEIVFPPTNEMQHIKMWPPYGTYDEKGNKVREY